MSGHKIIKGLEEAVAFARGEDTGARVSQHPTPPSGWNAAVDEAANVAEKYPDRVLHMYERGPPMWTPEKTQAASFSVKNTRRRERNER